MNLTSNHLSMDSELKLLLELVGPETVSLTQNVSSRSISSETDWPLLTGYACHHRLIPLLFEQVKKIPPGIVPVTAMNELDKQYKKSVRQCLAQTAELKRIIPALNKESIDVALLKGRALARWLYGDNCLRQSRDIDLLVKEQDIIRVDNILYQHGYKLARVASRMPLDSHRGRKFTRGRSELDYFNHDRLTTIDLHWHLSHSFHSFPVNMNDIWQHMEIQQHDHGQVKIMSASLHFIFLCYHGAKHHWLRLHWILDLAKMITRRIPDWADILDQAERAGVLPAVSLGAVLAHRFFESPIPDEITRNRVLLDTGRALADKMIPDMIKKPMEIEARVMPFMDFKRIKLGHHLQTGFPHKYLTWTDLLHPSESDYQSVKLPAPLTFLYFVVRYLNLVIKLGRRITKAIFSRFNPGKKSVAIEG